MKYKYFIPALIWMIIIFIESSMNGTSSSNQSNIIVDFIYSLLSIPVSYQDMISFMIRKCAHISEYTILTLLFYYGFYKNSIYTYLYPFIISFLFACTDEFHQLFVPRRAGMFQDVLIDSIGICIAILIIYLIRKKGNR